MKVSIHRPQTLRSLLAQDLVQFVRSVGVELSQGIMRTMVAAYSRRQHFRPVVLAYKYMKVRPERRGLPLALGFEGFTVRSWVRAYAYMKVGFRQLSFGIYT